MSEVKNLNCFSTIQPFFVITARETGSDKPSIYDKNSLAFKFEVRCGCRLIKLGSKPNQLKVEICNGF